MEQDLTMGFTQNELKSFIKNHEYDSHSVDAWGNDVYESEDRVIFSLIEIDELVCIPSEIAYKVWDKYWFEDKYGIIVTPYNELDEEYLIPLQFVIDILSY